MVCWKRSGSNPIFDNHLVQTYKFGEEWVMIGPVQHLKGLDQEKQPGAPPQARI
jgi:hypothetical protein